MIVNRNGDDGKTRHSCGRSQPAGGAAAGDSTPEEIIKKVGGCPSTAALLTTEGPAALTAG